ncbi:MAG TPA: tRNA (adenosine(37)-N6)-threonylcarbamoyltransferase complex dimerization subunit type 1 TsaB [Acidimicrobiia bacterium]|jgi:tRNA threonylcarbamoyl adenosine modification protein YeaZ|nr:tRNA (adenosine(37)-N6)-threonylcarbamoyltransferase complex dimerization subunit type 1 TsaB [Acidimicrobiia bacterium]
MRILAIDTATPASSVALGENGAIVALSVHVDPRGHVEFLVPAIDFCFERAGWRPDDLDLVAVDVGPGPYTGLRAGIATAQAVAAAVGVPVVTASSLTVLALRAATGRRTIWPVVDVRRGQIATAPYRPVPGGVVPDGPRELCSAKDLHGLLEADSGETLLVGDWHVLPGEVLRGLHRTKKGRPRYPTADVLLEIAEMRAANGNYAGAEELRPLYLREPDARINWSDFREEGMWPGAAS